MTELQTIENTSTAIHDKIYSRIPVKSWNLIHADKVEVQALTDTQGNPNVRIIVNDGELDHTFDKNSRISKSISYVSTKALADRLTGGKFFTINDQLIDFRDNQYTGYIHNHDAIQKLIDIVGVSKLTNRYIKLKHRSAISDIVLTNRWGTDSIYISEYKTGGEFQSILRYCWSPFDQTIRSTFELIRLICSNGMINTTNFFNAKIPMVNRWEEHMNIAYKQIQDKIRNRIHHRIVEMGQQRASVGDLIRISTHVHNRITNEKSIKSAEQYQRLLNIARIIDPRQHLSNFYKQTVFSNMKIANRMPGHLTAFDAWNIVTEISTHTNDSPDSSDTALQRIANDLMFNEEKQKQRMIDIDNNSRSLSSFSDPTAAFFGTMS